MSRVKSAYDYLKITAFIVVVTSIWAAMTATAEGIDWCILVSTNEIEVANVKELVHLTKLEKLDLSLNQLEELDLSEGTLLYLWSLNASFNKLRRFESQPLRLTHLTLQENMLSDVCFVSRFRSLRYLNLSFNRITYIPDDVFQNLTDLYFLDLKNNQITNADFVLLTTKVLHTLVLSNNRISKLPVKSFRYSKIVELYLDNNTLTNVDFLIYSNAAEINLNDNQLSTLNGKLFENKNKLKVLNVSGMKLTSVDFITSIPSLISVGMESNNVSCLPKGFLKNYKTLKEWFLLDNPLEDLICPMSSEWTVQEMCNISASDNKVQILMKDVNINDIMRCVLDRRNIFEDCEQKCNFASHTLFPPLLIFVSTLFNVI
ncbi:Protein lap4 [Gryllus bimaculatus]|nr:Protein lap4 [Gryllus bimaculatus]